MPAFSKDELKRARRVKEDELYTSEGYKKAVYLGPYSGDFTNHLFAFLIDLNIVLVPVYLWGVEFIMILSGIIPPAYFDLLLYVMYGLLFLTSCIWLPLYTAARGGVTIGCRMLGLRLVKAKGKRSATAIQLVLRQLFGFGLPMMLFGFFFSVFGIIGWWLVDGLVALCSPRQKTISDWIFGTALVYPPQYEMKVVAHTENDVPAAEEPLYEDDLSYGDSNDIEPYEDGGYVPYENPAVIEEEPAPKEKRRLHKENKKKNKSVQSKQVAVAPMTEEKAAPKPNPVVEVKPEPVVDPEDISKFDLHIRSNFSDDSDAEVEDIFRQAKDLNMEVISITDHNNARANAIAAHFAKLYEIKYIPGVEIDCQLYGERVRILGYYIDWNDPFFDGIERLSLKREKDLSLARIEAFEKLAGLKVDTDTLLANSRFKTLKPEELVDLVFDTLQARELPLIRKYLDGASSEKDARRRCVEECFGEDGPCAVHAEYPGALKVIEAIHNAGGMAILAGWHISELSNETIDSILESGIDGFEAFNPNNSTREQAFLVSLAKEEKVFITSGSDYHGSCRKDRHLGVTSASKKADQFVSVFTSALS